MKGMAPHIRFFLRGAVILVILHFPVRVSGQATRIRAVLDTNEILLGDQIYFRLEANAGIGTRVQFPFIPDTLTRGIEVLDRSPVDSVRMKDQTVTYLQRLLITGFDSGYFEIPPLPFIIHSGDKADTLLSLPQLLVVNRMLADTSITIYDIKTPYGAPVSLRELLPFIIGGLGLAVLVAGTIYYVRRRRKNLPLFDLSKPSEPPHVIALRELEKLAAEKLWQKDMIKQYHSRLTEILRTYIERRYTIPAMEQVTAEIIEDLRRVPGMGNDLCEQVLGILSLADMVKFAKYRPLPDEHDKSMLLAYKFVQETRPVEVLTGKEAGKQDEDRDEATVEISADKTVYKREEGMEKNK